MSAHIPPNNAIDVPTGIQPWEQQPGETTKQFAAFLIYLKLDPSHRSLERVAKKLKRDQTLLQRWSAQNHWVRRCAAHLRHIEAVEQAALVEARKEAVKRHLTTALQLQDIANKKLSDKRWRRKRVDSGRDVLSYAKAGVQMEQEAIGINPRRDDEPTSPPPRTNMLQEIEENVAAFEKRLIVELVAKLTDQPKPVDVEPTSVKELLAPTNPPTEPND